MQRGQDDDEICALSQPAFRSDCSVMAIGNSAADRQPNARAFILGASVQALKDGENLIEVFFLKTDAVVLDPQFAQFLAGVRRENPRLDFDQRHGARGLKLEGVADEVEQELAHLHRVGFDRWQGAEFDARAGFFEAHFQVTEDFFGDHGQIHGHERLGVANHAGEGQQIVNERAHPGGGILHSLQVFVRFRRYSSLALQFQPVPKSLNLAQWLLQIMGGDKGKLLELGIGPGQFGRFLRDCFLHSLR